MAKSSKSSLLPTELRDGNAIGAKVRVFNREDETYEGIIFTLDPVAHFLILGTFVLFTSFHMKKNQKEDKENNDTHLDKSGFFSTLYVAIVLLYE